MHDSVNRQATESEKALMTLQADTLEAVSKTVLPSPPGDGGLCEKDLALCCIMGV